MKRFLTALIFGFSSLAMPALAQDTKLPDISVPPLEADVNRDNRINPESFTEYSIQNSYLGDKIKLQYQIALINNLITWQKQVSEIQKAYKDIGVDYKTPKPPRGICAQIPANVPCYNAYPDLYPETEADLALRKQELEMAIAKEMEAEAVFKELEGSLRPELADQKTSTQSSKQEAKKESKKKATPKSDFEWVEIFCVSGDCQAVLTKISDSNYRTTVTMNDELQDGSVVTKIQPQRLEATKEGKVITLKPAPVNPQDRSNEDAVPPSSIGNMLDSFSKSKGTRKSKSLDDVDLGTGAQDNPGLSSPTGLF